MSRSPADADRRAGRRLIAAAVALGLIGAGLDAGRAALDRWVAATELPALAVATGTEVLARDGSLLRAFQVEDGLWRLAPPAAGVDPAFIEMLIAWEDRRFRSHAGVDPRAVLRAGAQAIRHRRVVSGASTLSMQVARLLERGPTGDWAGKLRQARVALALERRLGKERILQLYLTLAPYGGNVEGVRAGSLMWFGKEPQRLAPAEAALLVALPQAPEARRPDREAGRRAAKAARDRVLARAHALGLIDAEALASAQAAPLPDRRRDFPTLAPLLAQRLARENPGVPRIETTIDPALQRAAEAVVARATAGQAARVSAAAILADHRTGEILAHVGTAAWSDEASGGFIDMTRALRSPGSTLKPFVYALGFDDGLIHPETLVEDRPTAFGRWQPQNFDGHFRGTVTVRRALTESLNIPVLAVAEALGPARIAAAFRRAGMRVEVAGGVPGLAMVLGGAGVSLEDLVQGYAALARGGRPVTLHVHPGATGGEGTPLVGPVAAWYTAATLAQIAPPTGAEAGRLAFKTGTSYGHRDTLAVGFDGGFVGGVWLGRPDGTPVPGAFGADLAAPVLFDLFDALGPRAVPLPPPPSEALTLSTARLPAALRRFPPALAAPAEAPRLTTPGGRLAILFPPEGAEIAPRDAPLTVRLRGGTPPYQWLLNGAPAAAALRGETAEVAATPGFSELAVIDAQGRSQRVRFRLLAP
ncbi:penicillin-binding protein 1C [Paracoccus sp. S-4012]|uniref:penicillin-binding protein 1C n=1 Tax=Paracoccus sp. S-4012 TaxID=2665648 RepID=UPI0012B0B3CB|nr:penicillin-binding protein 1C [Paracoccus sp. S-4012]MRX51849.1 penicillin-binding protein 1C [Paracoccus sp. S-4012]